MIIVVVCSTVHTSCAAGSGVRWCYFYLAMNRPGLKFTFKVEYFKNQNGTWFVFHITIQGFSSQLHTSNFFDMFVYTRSTFNLPGSIYKQNFIPEINFCLLSALYVLVPIWFRLRSCGPFNLVQLFVSKPNNARMTPFPLTAIVICCNRRPTFAIVHCSLISETPVNV